MWDMGLWAPSRVPTLLHVEGTFTSLPAFLGGFPTSGRSSCQWDGAEAGPSDTDHWAHGAPLSSHAPVVIRSLLSCCTQLGGEGPDLGAGVAGMGSLNWGGTSRQLWKVTWVSAACRAPCSDGDGLCLRCPITCTH